ncbi:polyphosphate--glucose phosphotransferase [Quadrisphaera sp. KR29]|uniref:polyphosphate--glucose phosphotransferase n=1 Tax=Quadrisphaera sp. KR29 TaxID=3461391 RepID=UPI0040451823
MRGTGIGIDIGGSGIKGAPVDLAAGQFSAERIRIATPKPSTPDAVSRVVKDIVEQLGQRLPDGGAGLPVGITFPAVIQHGVARTAANVDKGWIDFDVATLMGAVTGHPVHVVNDADAAGVAEARYGAAKGVRGVVVVATLGTGIGTAVLNDGVLLPNTELGHLEVDGHDAETRASDAARERDDLSWSHWAKRLTKYFRSLEALLWPDLIVVGGGVSKKSEKFLPELSLRTPIVPAQLLNSAGIVGAAALASERHR